MKVNWQAIGALVAMLAVALGAFGAHSLERTLSPHLLDVYKTGAYYQMIHGIALAALGGQANRPAGARLRHTACLLLFVGVVIFSGSLYALSITGVALWGAVTPIGGLCFLSGWAVMALASLKTAE